MGILVRATAVAAAAIHDNMERSRSRRQVVILDSCDSGAFPAGLQLKDDGKVDIRAQFMDGRGEGRAILTAAATTRYAFEQTDDGLSLYTRFLVRGIETGEADLDGDGIVTIEELHDYVCRKLRAVRPAMKPEIYAGVGGNTLPVARAPIDPKARYREEVALALDHRGEITVAGRANPDHWRGRLELDETAFEAIEAEGTGTGRKIFHEKCREYGRLVREILERQGRLAGEAAPLDRINRQPLF